MSAGANHAQESLLRTLVPVLTAIVAGAVGGMITCYAGEIPVRERLTEVAVEVLRAPPTDSTRAIREWAKRVINKYSDVPFSAAADSALNRSALPANLSSLDWRPTTLSYDTAGAVNYFFARCGKAACMLTQAEIDAIFRKLRDTNARSGKAQGKPQTP